MKGSMKQTFASKVSVVLKETARGAELSGPAPACRAEQGAGPGRVAPGPRGAGIGGAAMCL